MGKKRGNKQAKEATPVKEQPDEIPAAAAPEETPVAPAAVAEDKIASPVVENETEETTTEEEVPVAEAEQSASAEETPMKAEETPEEPASPPKEEDKPILSVQESTSDESERAPEAAVKLLDEATVEQNPIFQTIVLLCTVIAQVAVLVYNLAAVQKYVLPHATKAFDRAQTLANELDKKYSATTKATEISSALVEDLERYDIAREVILPRSKQTIQLVGMVQERVARYFEMQ